MITTISNPNLLNLNKRCELYYLGANVFVPMGHCQAKQLADTLERFDAIDVAVEFQTSRDEKVRARDIATYTKRLRSLPAGYTFTGFSPKVIDGFEQTTMTGRLTRCE